MGVLSEAFRRYLSQRSESFQLRKMVKEMNRWEPGSHPQSVRWKIEPRHRSMVRSGIHSVKS
jgi:hypothetical protein